ncbi:hypothetical protein TcBrA4_0054750 [Trypanosoma cruzi]|nr:hypothetical protein TcBrA4_0054680 [Trypanosoma cruzi]KAF8284445.1 hypothetical protein TcBrA4_0054750 [Trypanosoma cruzi]
MGTMRRQVIAVALLGSSEYDGDEDEEGEEAWNVRGSSVYRNGSDSTLANQISLYRISLATSPPASARRGTRSRRGALIQTASTAQEENRFACSEDEFAESSKGVERLPQNRLFNKVRSRSWALVTLSGSVHGMFCEQEGLLNGSVKPLNDLTDQTNSGASLFWHLSSTDGHAGVASTVSPVDALLVLLSVKDGTFCF